MIIWDGKSASRQKDKYAAPDAADWAQIIKEVRGTQLRVNELTVEIEPGSVYSRKSNDFIIIGQPVVLDDAKIVKASKSRPEVLGISIVDIEPDQDVIYVVQGQLTLTDWTNVVGYTELIPGAFYYLSMLVVGCLTAVAPVSVDDVIVQVGRAQSKETLSIDIETPIYL